MSERTLAIIKPDAVAAGAAGKILARIEAAGFRVLALKMIRMSAEEAAGFYAVHRARPFFESLCAFMTQGPCIPMVLEADNAIGRLGDLVAGGPQRIGDAATDGRFVLDHHHSGLRHGWPPSGK